MVPQGKTTNALLNTVLIEKPAAQLVAGRFFSWEHS